MNKTIEKFKRIAPAIFLSAALSGTAAAQDTTANSESKPAAPNYVAVEQSDNAVDKEKAEFYKMTEMTAAAIVNGESDKAKAYAEALLKQAETRAAIGITATQFMSLISFSVRWRSMPAI